MKRIQAIATIATAAVVAVALTVPAVAPAHSGSAHAAKRHGHKHHRVVFRKRAHRMLTIADAGSPHTTADDKIGAIDSFTDGVLTLKLVGGKTVEGAVTPDTEIRCDGSTTPTPPAPTAGATRAHSADHGDDDGPGDDRGGDDGADSNGAGDYPGDHRGGRHCDHEDGVPCTTADLVAGAVVREAKLTLTADGLVFREITLAK